MLRETYTDEYVIYTVEPRKVKDNYTLRKSQKDRKKLSLWINELLKRGEVVITYVDEDGNEKTIGATKVKPPSCPFDLKDSPKEIEEFEGKTKEIDSCFSLFEMPIKMPILIPVNSVKQFVLKNDRITEISNSIKWNE